MGNSPEVLAAMKAAKEQMLRWPKWWFRFQLWRHRNGWIAKMLRETGAVHIIVEEIEKKRQQHGKAT